MCSIVEDLSSFEISDHQKLKYSQLAVNLVLSTTTYDYRGQNNEFFLNLLIFSNFILRAYSINLNCNAS